jgi:hypothetical protein
MTEFVNIAYEDALSEAVLERIISRNTSIMIAKRLTKGGFGYLRSNFASLSKAADVIPLVMLTDLDGADCAPSLIQDWRANTAYISPHLHLRVAVREVETWLLADQEGLSAHLGGVHMQLPQDVEALEDPKRTLLSGASKAKRAIRELVVRHDGRQLRQGLGYNAVLAAFVRSRWDLDSASDRSDSLARAIARIEAL